MSKWNDYFYVFEEVDTTETFLILTIWKANFIMCLKYLD